MLWSPFSHLVSLPAFFDREIREGSEPAFQSFLWIVILDGNHPPRLCQGQSKTSGERGFPSSTLA